jgi:hypothetical protein
MPEPFVEETPDCPACGLPLTICTSLHATPPDQPLSPEPIPRFGHLAGPSPEASVLVDREVWVPHFDPYGRPTSGSRLLYRPGDRITPDEARRVGILAIESHDPHPTETK